jgi:hypothetical protein
MIGLLLGALERVPLCVRRFVVATGALLALGAAMAAFTLSNRDGGHRRRPTPQHPVAASPPRKSAGRLSPPVSPAVMLKARGVAERFLAS